MKLVRAIRQARMLYRDVRDAPTGWATRSFVDAMTRAALLGIASWQLVMVGALLVESPPMRSLAVLLAIHVGVGAAALVAITGRIPIAAIVIAAYAAFFADWSIGASWNGPLLLAACWTANFASATPGMTVAGRRASAVVLAYALGFPPLMMWSRPDLGPQLPIAVFVTAIAILGVFWFGLAYPLGFVHEADAQEANADEQERLIAAQRSAIQRTAEDARVLHDTVINTLGAIANGGGAISDIEAVRQRCAHDIETVRILDSGATIPQSDHLDLQVATRGLGVRVIHSGLSDDEIEQHEQSLTPGTRDAAGRAVVELIRNAAKHAGVDAVSVHTSIAEGRLQIAVSDDGHGFDGNLPSGRGLARSVIDRAREAGIDVTLDTAPGEGTRVTLTCPGPAALTAPSADETTAGVDPVVDTLLLRSGFALSAGLSAVGFILAAANHPGQFTGEYPMALVVALVTLLAWRQHATGRGNGAGQVVILAAAAAAAFVCSAAAVGFGRTEVVFWQAIGPTGPLILLSTLHRSIRALLAAGALYVATMAAIIGLINRSDLTASANVVIAGLAGLLLVLGWDRFQATVRRIGVRTAQAHRRAAESQRELAARAAAADARRRWQSAGLTDSVALLQKFVDGAEPSEPDLRAAAAAEEAYLRQLTQLSPRALHVGTWLARTLAEARASGVELVVRSGDVDVTESDAAMLGHITTAAVRAVPSGEHVTVTLYPSDDQAKLTVVAPHPVLVEASSEWNDLVRVQNFGQQDMLEVAVAAWDGISNSSTATTEGVRP